MWSMEATTKQKSAFSTNRSQKKVKTVSKKSDNGKWQEALNSRRLNYLVSRRENNVKADVIGYEEALHYYIIIIIYRLQCLGHWRPEPDWWWGIPVIFRDNNGWTGETVGIWREIPVIPLIMGTKAAAVCFGPHRTNGTVYLDRARARTGAMAATTDLYNVRIVFVSAKEEFWRGLLARWRSRFELYGCRIMPHFETSQT